MHGVGDEPALQARGLGVRYGRTVALRNVDLTVEPGELVALVGPNGAGKTSLFRALLGLIAHDGDVVLHGRAGASERAPVVAFVPQRHDVELDFPITVEQVVAAGRRPWRRTLRRSRTADRQAVARALARVGLDGLETRSLGALSGGQVQRVFIARALAQEAGILLLDEPLTGIDATTTDALFELFTGLAAADAALVVASHELELVRRRFDRCVSLNQRVIGDGHPRDVLAPAELERLFVHG